MKENAEVIHAHHAREAFAGVLRLKEDGYKAGERADESDEAQSLGGALFLNDRIQHHNQHAENAEHKFRQDADVVGAGRRENLDGQAHWPTTRADTCANGCKSAWTAGSMALSQRIGV